MESKSVNIVFAGGGTGGHLFPALALAEEVRTLRPEANILFVGTKRKIEARLVPQKGYAFRAIWISGLHRGLRLENILFPMKVIVSLVQSTMILLSFKPDVVVGTGGYVAGPVLSVASLLGIPTVVLESNSYPGVTTRLLSRRATAVLLTFERSKQWLKRIDNVQVVGTPTRRELDGVDRDVAAAYFNMRPDRKTVLVFGGSLGASSLNAAVSQSLPELVARSVQVVWQTGEVGYQRYKDFAKDTQVWVNAFIERMDCAYAAADLVVCRAGATTLAELTRLGKPAVLVPYPHAAAQHQEINARTLVEADAAEMVREEELNVKLLQTIVRLLFDDSALQRMAGQAKKLGNPEAGKRIAEILLALGNA